MTLRSLFILITLLGITHSTAICKTSPYDTSYIENRRNDLTLKAFGGYSFSKYILNQNGNHKALIYKSNNNSNVGIGFNYRILSMNFGIVTPFVNNDNTRLGKTKMYDLQTSFYFKKYVVDIFWQYYKGYYLENSDAVITLPASNNITIRQDLTTRTTGISVLRFFNQKRFSYKAAYVQTEYQKKSAGSVIIGLDIHQFSIHADSAIIPSNIIDHELFNYSRFNHSQVLCLSVNTGYVYTLVVNKHYFLTTALIGGIGSNITSLTDDVINIKDTKVNWQLNGGFRITTGYNSIKYFARLQYVNSLIKGATPIANSTQEFEIGQFKLMIGIRLGVKRNFIQEARDKLFHK